MADLKDALLAVQTILREAGLSHLAAEIPIKLSGDLKEARSRVRAVDALMRLRKPPQAVLDRLGPSWRALLAEIGVIEKNDHAPK